jgi:hypothetical protein
VKPPVVVVVMMMMIPFIAVGGWLGVRHSRVALLLLLEAVLPEGEARELGLLELRGGALGRLGREQVVVGVGQAVTPRPALARTPRDGAALGWLLLVTTRLTTQLTAVWEAR